MEDLTNDRLSWWWRVGLKLAYAGILLLLLELVYLYSAWPEGSPATIWLVAYSLVCLLLIGAGLAIARHCEIKMQTK